MAILAALSVQHEYGLISPVDDALALPDAGPEPVRLDDEAEDAFADRHAKWLKAKAAGEAEFARRYEVATETGQWSELLLDGKQPTVFRVRQIPMTAWDAFRRLWSTSLGDLEAATLAFRLGVTRIDNLNLGFAIGLKPYVNDEGKRERAFGEILDEEVPNAIARAPGGRDVVHGIGLLIMKQRGGPLGK